METKILNLGSINGNVSVEIIRKNIKNVHLKVFRTCKITLSVPVNVPDEWIDSFLSKHVLWIDRRITKYKTAFGYNTLTDIKSGTSTQFLGKDIRIIKELSNQNYVEKEEKNVIIHVKNLEDDNLSQNLFENWWRDVAFKTYEFEMEKIYLKVFKKHNIKRPVITVKKMKTLWGSCNHEKGRITLNEYLLKADIRCIQYVILHELTHLIYPNHSKDFYDFLTVNMPDWPERKKQLDHDVVQGL